MLVLSMLQKEVNVMEPLAGMMLTIASSIDCAICYIELSTLRLKTISVDCQMSTAASEILLMLLSGRHLDISLQAGMDLCC